MVRKTMLATSALALLCGPCRAADKGAALCDLLSKPGARGNARGGDLNDAVVDQAKNLVFESLEAMSGFERVGKLGGVLDDAVYDPITAYLGQPTEGKVKALDDLERREAAITAFLKGGAKIVFPSVDVVVTGGNVIVAGVAYGVEEVAGQIPAYSLSLAKGIDFFAVEPQTRRGITRENIGEKVKTEDELRDLWFKTYAWKIKDFTGAEERKELLDREWPTLLAGWQRSRAALLMRRFRDELASRLAAAGKAAPPVGVFGLWQTAGGSVVAITGSDTAVEAHFCRTGKKAQALGFKSGDRFYWGGKPSQAAASEGRVVINMHVMGHPQPGDCPRLAPKDLGPYSVRITFDPDRADALEVVEKSAKYSAKTCRWADVPLEPETNRWTRVKL